MKVLLHLNCILEFLNFTKAFWVQSVVAEMLHRTSFSLCCSDSVPACSGYRRLPDVSLAYGSEEFRAAASSSQGHKRKKRWAGWTVVWRIYTLIFRLTRKEWMYLFVGALPECLTDGVDVMTELQQQEMKILEEVLKWVFFLSSFM